jgi:hypothetical protein
MAACPGYGHSRRACSITGLAGVALATDDIVTGETALRAIKMENGLVRVSNERPNGAEFPACHLFVNAGHTADGHEDAWTRCFSEQYGDWSYFVSSFAATCNRAVVIEATDDAVEVSFEWSAHSLGSPGLVERNPSGTVNYYNNAVESPFSQSTSHYITEVYLRKVVRIQRGVQGYWLAWRSYPDFTPTITAHSQGLNNDKDHTGEREFGTGGGTRVAWSSTGKVAYFPAWRSQRDWSAVTAAIPSFDNFAWWPGIDDPPYANWDHATVIAMQPAGFPAHQTTGPWYIAGLTADGVVHVLVQKNPQEAGVWCYAGQNGNIVNHLTNPWIEADGQRTRFPVFIGADHYAADSTAVAKAGYTGNVAYGNEPSTTAQATATALVNAAVEAWPT